MFEFGKTLNASFLNAYFNVSLNSHLKVGFDSDF